MAKKKYKKKNTAGKVIAGLSIGTILFGATAGVIYTLEQNPVSASQNQEGTGDVSVEDLQNKVSELEQSKTELQAKIDKLTADKSTLEATILENQASIGSLNSQIANLDVEISALRSEKLELGSANQELTNLIESLESERASLQIELSLKEEAIINLMNEVSSLRQQIDDLSNGRYNITIGNSDITMTRADYNLSGMNFDDVVSVNPKGEHAPYTISSEITEETEDYTKYVVYYFNGTSENGDYAIRNVTVLKTSTIITVNNQKLKDFDFKNATLNFEDIEILSLSDRFTNIGGVEITISKYGTSNQNIYLTENGDNYTFEEGNYYRVWINYTLIGDVGNMYESTELIISTSTTGIYRINWGENISVNSSGMNAEGNYEINFNGNGIENMSLQIAGVSIENAMNGNMWELQYRGLSTTTTDGTKYETRTGGYGVDYGIQNMNTIITTDNGEINICLDLSHIFNEYQKWTESQNNENISNLGIAVKDIVYFENGKGFDDTPEVTSMYEEGQYVVFEFNAFGQVKNKLYLCLGDGQGYVELGDGDRQTAVVSLESNSDEEAVLNIGYALPGTQLHITIVPTK